jgi:hypothetical protein
MKDQATIQKLAVSDSIGEISVAVQKPESINAMLVLAHGAGAGMQHNFMTSLSDELSSLSIGTIRFNFPYMEKGSKRPDMPAVAHKAIARVIEFAQKNYPDVPLFAGGKSFGGRMTSQLLSKDKIDVRGLVFFGFPLHPAGAPAIDRAEHLSSVAVPMLFLQGTRDALAEWELITGVVKKLPKATLKEFEGADHSYKSGKKNFIPALAETAATWMNTVAHQK